MAVAGISASAGFSFDAVWHAPCFIPRHEKGRNLGPGQAEKRGIHRLTGNENHLDRKIFMKGGKAGKQGEKADNHQQRN